VGAATTRPRGAVHGAYATSPSGGSVTVESGVRHTSGVAGLVRSQHGVDAAAEGRLPFTGFGLAVMAALAAALLAGGLALRRTTGR
jgi:hypothetical protein